MASGQTSNYGLNQWAAEDKILREEFNQDNFKIETAIADRGNCKIKTGTYVGTGTAGRDTPVTLTFDFYPLIVLLDGAETQSETTKYYIAHRHNTCICSPTYYHSASYHYGRPLYLTWADNGLSFYVDIDAPEAQFNVLDRTYHYIVIGI